MKFKLTIIACFVLTTFYSQDISQTSFGKGIINYTAKDNSFKVKFATRFQVRSISSWDYESNQYTSPKHNFIIRRARLKFNGFAYSPKLKYKIELGLSNRDISGANQFNRNTPSYILDAVIMWNFTGNWELWIGQAKLPGNIERLVSSANLQLIDRSLLNSRFNIDRDLGLQLHHKTNLGNNFIMHEKFAISQGEGRNVTEGNEGGLQYTTRLEFLPLGVFKTGFKHSDLKREKNPKLMIGLTYNLNQDAVRERSNMGNYMFKNDGSLYETDITTYFADAVFKFNGISFMAEYAKRTSPSPIAKEIDHVSPTGDIVLTGQAINIQTGYLFKNHYELVGRFTSVNYESITNTLPKKQYTLGLNKFIVGHKLKIQSDINFTTLDKNKDNITFRLGFDIHF